MKNINLKFRQLRNMYHRKLLMFSTIFLFTFYLLLFAQGAAAQTVNPAKPMIQVSPFILNISLSPGKKYEYEIEIKNLLKIPLPLHALIENLDEGGIQSISSWSSLDQSDMIIPAGQTRILNLTIQLPNKIALGGYYGSLYLEPVASVNTNGQLVQAKIGIPILANIGVLDPKAKRAEIEDFSFDRWFYGNNDPITPQLNVKNISLYHFSAKPVVFIKPFFAVEERHELDERIILPGKAREWKNLVSLKNNSGGLYFARLLLSTGSGQQVDERSFFILSPNAQIMYILMIVLVLFALIFGFKLRKSLRKALNAFLEKP